MDLEIQHFSHDHPLILRNKKKNSVDNCYGCDLPIWGGPSYGCNQCEDFILHKSCIELPQQIQHPVHPQHPLILLRETLSDVATRYCDACGKWCFGFVFECAACDFDLDVQCSSQVPTISYEGHEHLLIPLAKFISRRRVCNFCGTRCDRFVFRCVECDFNVHKLCAELPQQIRHPFHPPHPLSLGNHGVRLECRACNVYIDKCSFRCEECSFNLCDKCALLVPSIKYEGHEHLLTLFEKVYWTSRPNSGQCNSCETFCDSFVFRCVECDFNSHIHCLPSLLPSIINHKCHKDTLTLLDSVVKKENLDKAYCDSCGKERDPKHAVYNCAECHFVAHIGCVISEVLPSLIAGQESNVRPKKVVIKRAPTVLKGVLDATVGDEVTASSASAALPSNEKVEVGVSTAGDEVTAPGASAALPSSENVEVGVSTAGDEVKATGASAALPSSENVEVGVSTAVDPSLAKLDEEIARLHVDLEALQAKREQYVASKMPSAIGRGLE
ncbi:hypothetical protein L1049_023143 [Liquidambar formosana]|uniref:Phorbol-ester/DAG-type domain-containing protein n=1 Tax=Liquidambar formosana TaxID=63359 RepID=A0AAP0RF45_LIQFO